MDVAQRVNPFVGTEAFNVAQVLGARRDNPFTIGTAVVVPGAVGFVAPAQDAIGYLDSVRHVISPGVKDRFWYECRRIRKNSKSVDEFRQFATLVKYLIPISMSINNVSSALRRLDLSDFEQKIYLSLLREGRAPARVLAARTGITRPSVYDQLKSLIALNLVVELDIEGKAEFAAADIKYLDALLADKIDRLEQSREFLAEAIPALVDSIDTVTPKLRFFEGADGVKQLLKDIMWHDKTTLQIIWPTAEMDEVFDSAFLRWFDERRQKRTLAAEVLFVGKSRSAVPDLFTTGPKDSAKNVPATTSITMATIIYDSKVASISSHAEAFGFIVESAEFAKSERMKFKALWG